ncbi:MAG: hypothetical protein KIH64_006815, partial [Mycobacterium sp.]|nr:hypothetical protein [Mycobacterium sp.]
MAGLTTPPRPVRFVPLSAGTERQRSEVLRLTREYFRWMNTEIAILCGLSIPDIVGTDLDEYVSLTMDAMCGAEPADGIFYLVEDGGKAAGMGGLRRLPDGSAEVVRILSLIHI